MIKGYATSGDMAKAFSLFDEIQAMDDMIPDEIVYNSLIDGSLPPLAVLLVVQ